MSRPNPGRPGEKSKGKFQSVDINSLYVGKSTDNTYNKQNPRQHGLQSLGKVGVRRMPVVQLASEKKENRGNDPSTSLVPTGSNSGWRNRNSPEEAEMAPTAVPPKVPRPMLLPQYGGQRVPVGDAAVIGGSNFSAARTGANIDHSNIQHQSAAETAQIQQQQQQHQGGSNDGGGLGPGGNHVTIGNKSNTGSNVAGAGNVSAGSSSGGINRSWNTGNSVGGSGGSGSAVRPSGLREDFPRLNDSATTGGSSGDTKSASSSHYTYPPSVASSHHGPSLYPQTMGNWKEGARGDIAVQQQQRSVAYESSQPIVPDSFDERGGGGSGSQQSGRNGAPQQQHFYGYPSSGGSSIQNGGGGGTSRSVYPSEGGYPPGSTPPANWTDNQRTKRRSGDNDRSNRQQHPYRPGGAAGVSVLRPDDLNSFDNGTGGRRGEGGGPFEEGGDNWASTEGEIDYDEKIVFDEEDAPPPRPSSSGQSSKHRQQQHYPSPSDENNRRLVSEEDWQGQQQQRHDQLQQQQQHSRQHQQSHPGGQWGGGGSRGGGTSSGQRYSSTAYSQEPPPRFAQQQQHQQRNAAAGSSSGGYQRGGPPPGYNRGYPGDYYHPGSRPPPSGPGPGPGVGEDEINRYQQEKNQEKLNVIRRVREDREREELNRAKSHGCSQYQYPATDYRQQQPPGRPGPGQPPPPPDSSEYSGYYMSPPHQVSPDQTVPHTTTGTTSQGHRDPASEAGGGGRYNMPPPSGYDSSSSYPPQSQSHAYSGRGGGSARGGYRHSQQPHYPGYGGQPHYQGREDRGGGSYEVEVPPPHDYGSYRQQQPHEDPMSPQHPSQPPPPPTSQYGIPPPLQLQPSSHSQTYSGDGAAPPPQPAVSPSADKYSNYQQLNYQHQQQSQSPNKRGRGGGGGGYYYRDSTGQYSYPDGGGGGSGGGRFERSGSSSGTAGPNTSYHRHRSSGGGSESRDYSNTGGTANFNRMDFEPDVSVSPRQKPLTTSASFDQQYYTKQQPPPRHQHTHDSGSLADQTMAGPLVHSMPENGSATTSSKPSNDMWDATNTNTITEGGKSRTELDTSGDSFNIDDIKIEPSTVVTGGTATATEDHVLADDPDFGTISIRPALNVPASFPAPPPPRGQKQPAPLSLPPSKFTSLKKVHQEQRARDGGPLGFKTDDQTGGAGEKSRTSSVTTISSEGLSRTSGEEVKKIQPQQLHPETSSSIPPLMSQTFSSSTTGTGAAEAAGRPGTTSNLVPLSRTSDQLDQENKPAQQSPNFMDRWSYKPAPRPAQNAWTKPLVKSATPPQTAGVTGEEDKTNDKDTTSLVQSKPAGATDGSRGDDVFGGDWGGGEESAGRGQRQSVDRPSRGGGRGGRGRTDGGDSYRGNDRYDYRGGGSSSERGRGRGYERSGSRRGGGGAIGKYSSSRGSGRDYSSSYHHQDDSSSSHWHHQQQQHESGGGGSRSYSRGGDRDSTSRGRGRSSSSTYGGSSGFKSKSGYYDEDEYYSGGGRGSRGSSEYSRYSNRRGSRGLGSRSRGRSSNSGVSRYSSDGRPARRGRSNQSEWKSRDGGGTEGATGGSRGGRDSKMDRLDSYEDVEDDEVSGDGGSKSGTDKEEGEGSHSQSSDTEHKTPKADIEDRKETKKSGPKKATVAVNGIKDDNDEEEDDKGEPDVTDTTLIADKEKDIWEDIDGERGDEEDTKDDRGDDKKGSKDDVNDVDGDSTAAASDGAEKERTSEKTATNKRSAASGSRDGSRGGRGGRFYEHQESRDGDGRPRRSERGRSGPRRGGLSGRGGGYHRWGQGEDDGTGGGGESRSLSSMGRGGSGRGSGRRGSSGYDSREYRGGGSERRGGRYNNAGLSVAAAAYAGFGGAMSASWTGGAPEYDAYGWGWTSSSGYYGDRGSHRDDGSRGGGRSYRDREGGLSTRGGRSMSRRGRGTSSRSRGGSTSGAPGRYSDSRYSRRGRRRDFTGSGGGSSKDGANKDDKGSGAGGGRDSTAADGDEDEYETASERNTDDEEDEDNEEDSVTSESGEESNGGGGGRGRGRGRRDHDDDDDSSGSDQHHQRGGGGGRGGRPGGGGRRGEGYRGGGGDRNRGSTSTRGKTNGNVDGDDQVSGDDNTNKLSSSTGGIKNKLAPSGTTTTTVPPFDPTKHDFQKYDLNYTVGVVVIDNEPEFGRGRINQGHHVGVGSGPLGVFCDEEEADDGQPFQVVGPKKKRKKDVAAAAAGLSSISSFSGQHANSTDALSQDKSRKLCGPRSTEVGASASGIVPLMQVSTDKAPLRNMGLGGGSGGGANLPPRLKNLHKDQQHYSQQLQSAHSDLSADQQQPKMAIGEWQDSGATGSIGTWNNQLAAGSTGTNLTRSSGGSGPSVGPSRGDDTSVGHWSNDMALGIPAAVPDVTPAASAPGYQSPHQTATAAAGGGGGTGINSSLSSIPYPNAIDINQFGGSMAPSVSDNIGGSESGWPTSFGGSNIASNSNPVGSTGGPSVDAAHTPLLHQQRQTSGGSSVGGGQTGEPVNLSGPDHLSGLHRLQVEPGPGGVDNSITSAISSNRSSPDAKLQTAPVPSQSLMSGLTNDFQQQQHQQLAMSPSDHHQLKPSSGGNLDGGGDKSKLKSWGGGGTTTGGGGGISGLEFPRPYQEAAEMGVNFQFEYDDKFDTEIQHRSNGPSTNHLISSVAGAGSHGTPPNSNLIDTNPASATSMDIASQLSSHLLGASPARDTSTLGGGVGGQGGGSTSSQMNSNIDVAPPPPSMWSANDYTSSAFSHEPTNYSSNPHSSVAATGIMPTAGVDMSGATIGGIGAPSSLRPSVTPITGDALEAGRSQFQPGDSNTSIGRTAGSSTPSRIAVTGGGGNVGGGILSVSDVLTGAADNELSFVSTDLTSGGGGGHFGMDHSPPGVTHTGTSQPTPAKSSAPLTVITPSEVSDQISGGGGSNSGGALGVPPPPTYDLTMNTGAMPSTAVASNQPQDGSNMLDGGFTSNVPGGLTSEHQPTPQQQPPHVPFSAAATNAAAAAPSDIAQAQASSAANAADNTNEMVMTSAAGTNSAAAATATGAAYLNYNNTADINVNNGTFNNTLNVAQQQGSMGLLPDMAPTSMAPLSRQNDAAAGVVQSAVSGVFSSSLPTVSAPVLPASYAPISSTPNSMATVAAMFGANPPPLQNDAPSAATAATALYQRQMSQPGAFPESQFLPDLQQNTWGSTGAAPAAVGNNVLLPSDSYSNMRNPLGATAQPATYNSLTPRASSGANTGKAPTAIGSNLQYQTTQPPMALGANFASLGGAGAGLFTFPYDATTGAFQTSGGLAAATPQSQLLGTQAANTGLTPRGMGARNSASGGPAAAVTANQYLNPAAVATGGSSLTPSSLQTGVAVGQQSSLSYLPAQAATTGGARLGSATAVGNPLFGHPLAAVQPVQLLDPYGLSAASFGQQQPQMFAAAAPPSQLLVQTPAASVAAPRNLAATGSSGSTPFKNYYLNSSGGNKMTPSSSGNFTTGWDAQAAASIDSLILSSGSVAAAAIPASSAPTPNTFNSYYGSVPAHPGGTASPSLTSASGNPATAGAANAIRKSSLSKTPDLASSNTFASTTTTTSLALSTAPLVSSSAALTIQASSTFGSSSSGSGPLTLSKVHPSSVNAAAFSPAASSAGKNPMLNNAPSSYTSSHLQAQQGLSQAGGLMSGGLSQAYPQQQTLFPSPIPSGSVRPVLGGGGSVALGATSTGGGSLQSLHGGPGIPPTGTYDDFFNSYFAAAALGNTPSINSLHQFGGASTFSGLQQPTIGPSGAPAATAGPASLGARNNNFYGAAKQTPFGTAPAITGQLQHHTPFGMTPLAVGAAAFTPMSQQGGKKDSMAADGRLAVGSTSRGGATGLLGGGGGGGGMGDKLSPSALSFDANTRQMIQQQQQQQQRDVDLYEQLSGLNLGGGANLGTLPPGKSRHVVGGKIGKPTAAGPTGAKKASLLGTPPHSQLTSPGRKTVGAVPIGPGGYPPPRFSRQIGAALSDAVANSTLLQKTGVNAPGGSSGGVGGGGGENDDAPLPEAPPFPRGLEFTRGLQNVFQPLKKTDYLPLNEKKTRPAPDLRRPFQSRPQQQQQPDNINSLSSSRSLHQATTVQIPSLTATSTVTGSGNTGSNSVAGPNKSATSTGVSSSSLQPPAAASSSLSAAPSTSSTSASSGSKKKVMSNRLSNEIQAVKAKQRAELLAQTKMFMTNESSASTNPSSQQQKSTIGVGLSRRPKSSTDSRRPADPRKAFAASTTTITSSSSSGGGRKKEENNNRMNVPQPSSTKSSSQTQTLGMTSIASVPTKPDFIASPLQQELNSTITAPQTSGGNGGAETKLPPPSVDVNAVKAVQSNTDTICVTAATTEHVEALPRAASSASDTKSLTTINGTNESTNDASVAATAAIEAMKEALEDMEAKEVVMSSKDEDDSHGDPATTTPAPVVTLDHSIKSEAVSAVDDTPPARANNLSSLPTLISSDQTTAVVSLASAVLTSAVPEVDRPSPSPSPPSLPAPAKEFISLPSAVELAAADSKTPPTPVIATTATAIS